MSAELLSTLGTSLTWIGWALTPLLAVPLLALVFPGTFERLCKALIRVIDALSSGAMGLAILSVIILTAAMLAIVFLRYVFGLSFTWLNEIVTYAFAATFMLGAAAALRDDAHVRVDILRPRFGENGRNWIELAGLYLLLFPFAIRLLDLQEQGLMQSWTLLEGSRESDGLPIFYLFKTLLPVFCVLMIAQGASEACKAALRLTGRLAPATPSAPEASHGT
jgi:TRAP-type mannitol/chloroaromatic compound transport system permease small subunit